MNLEQLKQSDRIIFECISGSHAYGTSTPKSDLDIRGFYINPSTEYLGLVEPAGQIGDEKHDITYYSLKRAFELLQTANPNMIEILWMPEDCVKIKTPIMEKLIANRDLFISKKCFHTHSGYAHAQISKATGQNKKVNNPHPKEQPKKEDFCWVIATFDESGYKIKDDGTGHVVFDPDNSVFPCRPIPLSETELNLSEFHASSLEHSHNIFRLYHYGKEAKGVFRGDDMLVCESVPKEDEFDYFHCLLIYNQDMYERALKDHKSYWDWVQNRNNNRWLDQEKGLVQYDSKNLMHCLRLLMSGESILTKGYPIVRFEGEQREYLMKIRRSEMDYDDLMEEVERRMANLEALYKNSDAIPNKVNMKKINELYMELAGGH